MVELRMSSNEILPEDLYDADLIKVEEKTGANGIYLEWLFDVQRELIPGFTGTSTAPGAKARRWAEALMGEPIPDGEVIDLSAFYGAAVRVYVSVVNGRSGQMNRVERVLPAKHAGILSEEVSIRIVRETGILMDGRWYTAPALTPWIGQVVCVCREPADESYIYAYRQENGRKSWFIGAAMLTALGGEKKEPDPELTSANPPVECPRCHHWVVTNVYEDDGLSHKVHCPACGWKREG